MRCINLLLTLFLSLLFVLTSFAQDWDDCQWELEKLTKVAKNAAWASEEASSAKSYYDDAYETYQNCLLYPDIYDYYDDGCSSQKWDYESERDDYQIAVQNLLDEMYDLNRALRLVQISCEFEFDLKVKHRIPANYFLGDICTRISGYKGSIPDSSLFNLCILYLPADSCKKCLGIE